MALGHITPAEEVELKEIEKPDYNCAIVCMYLKSFNVSL